jgi:hypothetical protein
MKPSRFIYPSPGFDYYWKNGHGRKMLKKLKNVPERKSIEEKIPMLFEFDSLADDVIKEVYLKVGFREADTLLENIFSNGIDSVSNVPECLRKLFSQVNELPAWLDKNKLENGSAFCRRSGALGLIVLRDYCLMGGYESAAINKPLIFTEALKKGAAKRMAETIEFWVNVTGENALAQSGLGFKHTIKVRLMHAFARISILKMPTWNSDSWGIPINQWDMVATNLGFSLAFMDGLKNLGFRPTKDEVEGLLHFWKYIGYLLGIPSDYLPDSEERAIEELYCWTITQPPADEDTKALVAALSKEPLLSSFPKRNWQKKLLIKIHLGYNHFFLGERSCQTMGLPPTKLRYYPYLVRYIKSIHEFFVLSNRRYYKTTDKQGRKIQEKIKYLFLKGHNPVQSKH